LSVVNPSQITDNAVPALSHVEAITADNSPANLDSSVRIPPSPRRITFEYTGLSLAVPGRIRFRYFLEGFDSTWSQPVAAREAVYTNLGPGPYRFRLAASNSEGLWNGPETAVAFRVAPAYYQTYWFRLLALTSMFGLLFVLYRLRMRQLRKQYNISLEARVSERTRIARDLHDTLLQSFQGVLLQFHALTYVILDRPAEAREGLESAIEQARQAITEGRDAVQGLRSSTAVSHDLTLVLSTLGDKLAAEPTEGGHSADFRLLVEGAPRDLAPLVGGEIYSIAAEALRNAFRHAHAARIEVELHFDAQQLRLRVRDNGKGIDPQVFEPGGSDGHYGLTGMQERAKAIGGKITVWSELGSGTETELSIPADVAYAKSPAARRPTFWRRGA